MDFADIDRTERDAEGTWLHLQVDGKGLYWDGEALCKSSEEKEGLLPCRVKVHGVTKPEILAIHKKVEAANAAHAVRIGKASDSEYEEIMMSHNEKMRSLDDDLALAAVFEFENIYAGGKLASPTPDLVKKLFGGGSMFLSQIAIHTARDVGFSIPAAQN